MQRAIFFESDESKKGGCMSGSSSGGDREAHLPKQFDSHPTRLELRRRDFLKGTVRITMPDTYVLLKENVVCNFPDPEEATSPLHLGFFCAISVEAPRCVVDLGGHSLSQSEEYRQRQRFFSLIELNNSPFPPGKARFTTPLASPSDVTIKNGTLGESSHFSIHGALCGSRILVERVTMRKFEVGAVSISGADDVTIRRCKIGQAARPKTSSAAVMLQDLGRAAQRNGQKEAAKRLWEMTGSWKVKTPEHSDALVRSIVISPTFNVGMPNLGEKKRLRRVSLHSLDFDDVHSEPLEVVGISTSKGGPPLKDLNGNLISMEDAMAGSLVSRVQASLTTDLPSGARSKLMRGPSSSFEPVRGLDVRGHDLRMKASLFCRVDSCDSVTCHGARAGKVHSKGRFSAAVGFMFNACTDVSIRDVFVDGVRVSDVCADALSDARPQAGMYMRQCKGVDVERLVYKSSEACSFAMKDTRQANLSRCTLNAPLTASNTKDLHVRE